ncbi:MAG: DUF692 domain-containing protein [Polyangiaceae bacterium]
MTTSVGVGLRTSHYDTWLAGEARATFVEGISENFSGRGGRPRAVLECVRKDADLALHGVSLSIGGTDPLDRAYLREIRELVRASEPRFVSDHLCFGTAHGVSAHDLLPLPRTEETLAHVVSRVSEVQEVLGRRIALENVSSYLEYAHNEFDECTFVREVAARADCLLLIDVNNIVVSAHNHGFDAKAYLGSLPAERVAYLHVAGHSTRRGYRFDDHASPPDAEVKGLFTVALEMFGAVPAIFEWDENVPTLAAYLQLAEEIARCSP